MKKRILLVLLALVLALALTACGDDEAAADAGEYEEDVFEGEEEQQGMDDGADREAIVQDFYQLQTSCNDMHNNIVSLIDTGAEAGIDFDPALVEAVNAVAEGLQESQAIIESGGLDDYSTEELARERDAMEDALEMLTQHHATFVANIEAAGYVVE